MTVICGIIGDDVCLFFFKQKTSYEMRISDWSSDVCSSDLRGVDFQSITDHLERMTRLIIDICGGQAGPLDDQVINLPERKPGSMRPDRCHRVLGVLVTRQEVEGIFKRLGLPLPVTDEVVIVDPLSYPFDLFIEEDLIEAMARA